MTITTDIVGAGTDTDPLVPEVSADQWTAWTDTGDGTGTLTLTDEAARQAKSDAVKAANALNVGSAWADVEAVFGDDPLVPAIKKWLAEGTDSDGPVKKTWSGFIDLVPKGFVVSHDAALWKATVETSAEPSTSSDDWTLIFSL